MTTLTKEDIEKITAELELPWGRVGLDCDGYTVTVAVVRARALKYELAVFVNGYQKGSHIMEDCEERRRFLRPSTRSLYPPAKQKAFIKDCGKRMAKKLGIDKRFTIHSHYWLSVRSMLRHFAANNSNIKLIGIGDAAMPVAPAIPEVQGHA